MRSSFRPQMAGAARSAMRAYRASAATQQMRGEKRPCGRPGLGPWAVSRRLADGPASPSATLLATNRARPSDDTSSYERWY